MKISMLIVLAGGIAVLNLTGCGGGTTPASGALSSFATLPDGLTLKLTEDRSSVPVGGQVEYTETILNSTAIPIQTTIIGVSRAQPRSLDLNYSLHVVNSAGSDLLCCPPRAAPNISTFTLNPGDSISGAEAIVLPSAGTYTATIGLLAQGSTGFTVTSYDRVVAQAQ